MVWKRANLVKWADRMGVAINEIDQKLKLRNMIIKIKEKQGLSRDDLASLGGISRSHVAQIEAGVKLHRTSFDTLLRVLRGLGYRYKITATKSP